MQLTFRVAVAMDGSKLLPYAIFEAVIKGRVGKSLPYTLLNGIIGSTQEEA